MCKTDFFYGDYRKESIGVLKIAFCSILFANVRKTTEICVKLNRYGK